MNILGVAIFNVKNSITKKNLFRWNFHWQFKTKLGEIDDCLSY